MMKQRRRSWYLLTMVGLLAALASLMLITGCSKNPVVTENVDTQAKLDWLNANFGSGGPSLGSGISIDRCVVLYDTTIVQTVNQYGYQMNVIRGAAQIGFSLPYMAVSGPVTLTLHVTLYQAPFGKFWLLDCGPEGQQFNNPLYVQPNSAARSGMSVVLFYFNPDTGAWEVEEVGSASGSSSPQLPIHHFSKYGIS